MILMPLIVYTAQKCDEGVEGSLFALMMSISNLSGIIATQLGALTAKILNVSSKNFNNLHYLMIIAIAGDFIVPMYTIQRMFGASSQDSYSSLDHTQELPMILGNNKETSENKQAKSANMRATSEEFLDCKQETLVSHSRKQDIEETDHMSTEHHTLTPAEHDLIAKVEAYTSVHEPSGRDSFVI